MFVFCVQFCPLMEVEKMLQDTEDHLLETMNIHKMPSSSEQFKLFPYKLHHHWLVSLSAFIPFVVIFRLHSSLQNTWTTSWPAVKFPTCFLVTSWMTSCRIWFLWWSDSILADLQPQKTSTTSSCPVCGATSTSSSASHLLGKSFGLVP